MAIQLATEMALNLEVVWLGGWMGITLFGNPNKATAIAIAITIYDLRNFGSWKFGISGIWEFGILRIWDPGSLGSWEFGILGIWDLGNLGSWEFEI